jgi:hypothetical protein
MSVLSNNTLAGSSGQGGGAGYEIDFSLRFNPEDSGHLSKTYASAGNRKTFTLSYWIKECGKGTSPYNNPHILWSGTGVETRGGFAHRGTGSDAGKLYLFNQESNSTNCQVWTNSLHRDFSAWKHIVLAVDTTQATSTNRVKIYINGVEETLNFSTTPAQNLELQINASQLHRIGRGATDAYANAFLADVQFIDGQALAASDFGETDSDGVWQPIEYAGTYYIDVANATGSAPIYNTTDKFGLVKGTGYRSDSFAGTTAGTGLVLAIPGDVATDVHHNINTGSSQATVTNDGVAVNTSNSRLYGSSLQFESANTDSLTVQNSDMAFGTGDLCVEFWVYNKTNKNYNAFISTRDANGASSGFVIASDTGGDLYVHSNAALAGNYSGDLTLPLNQWSHVAYTRASGTHRLFLNGVAASNSTTTSRDFTYGTLKIGDNPYATDEPVNAEMQDIRVYKGVAKYTSNFTVPDRVSNSFHLDFSDTSSNAALGTDTSGNGNTWTVNNLAATNLGATTNSSVSASNTYVVSDVMATVTGTYDFENAFDGNSGTIGYIGQVIFHNEGTYSKPIVANSSGGVEVMGSGAGITAAINGGSQVNCANGGFTKISGTFNGTLDSINVYNNTSGASYFTAVRVNGVEIAVRRQSPASEIDLYRDSPVNGNSANDTGAGGEITGNYATMNPLSKTSVITLSNGNLQISASQGHAKSTIGISSGKWYAEYTQGTGLGMCGVADKTAAADNYLGQTGNGYGYYSSGTTYAPGAAGSSYGASYTTGDVIGIAFDADNGTLVFYKNGSSQGTAFTGLTSGPYFFAVGVDTMANSTMNFGQRPFAYTAPSGYKCLNTANLSDPTIADGSTAFDSKLYSGTGSSQSITGLGFSPDLVWTKNRGASASHALYDSVRGAGELLRSNETTAEVNVSSRFTSFDSNGFSIGGTSIENNGSSNSYVSWAWDAGSSNTTIAAGGLNSSVYDQSQTWSNSLTRYTVSGGSSAGSATDAFSGTIWSMSNAANSGYASDNIGSSITFAPTSGTLVGRVVKLYQRDRPSTVTVNGTAATITTSGNTRICTVDLGSSQNITSVVTTATTDGQTNAFSYIEVDGKLLVDSGVSVTSVPSIASTVRANPSAGFSIVSYTGSGSAATIGHNLNTVPSLVIVKNRDAANYWQVFHVSVGNTKSLHLNATSAPDTASSYWNDTSPTTSVFSVGSSVSVNNSGSNIIAYCFAPVEGYSSAFSFTGTGVDPGPFVYLGFRPKLIIIKRTDTTSVANNWRMIDMTINPYNVADTLLFANLSQAELTEIWGEYDALSNGFRVMTPDSNQNASGGSYIGFAFAEHPFKTSRAR